MEHGAIHLRKYWICAVLEDAGCRECVKEGGQWVRAKDERGVRNLGGFLTE